MNIITLSNSIQIHDQTERSLQSDLGLDYTFRKRALGNLRVNPILPSYPWRFYFVPTNEAIKPSGFGISV